MAYGKLSLTHEMVKVGSCARPERHGLFGGADPFQRVLDGVTDIEGLVESKHLEDGLRLPGEPRHADLPAGLPDALEQRRYDSHARRIDLPQSAEVDDNFPYGRCLDGDHLGLEVVQIRDVEAAPQDDDSDVAPPGTL